MKILIILMFAFVAACSSPMQIQQDTRAINEVFYVDTDDALARIAAINYETESERQDINYLIAQIKVQDQIIRKMLSEKSLTEIATSSYELKTVVYSLEGTVGEIKTIVDPYFDSLDPANQKILAGYYGKAEAAYLAYERSMQGQMQLNALLDVINLAAVVAGSAI